jgi:hypothetical protein
MTRSTYQMLFVVLGLLLSTDAWCQRAIEHLIAFCGRSDVPIVVPSDVPEHRRAEYQKMVAIKRELVCSPALFPHQAQLVLQDVKILEGRPENNPGEWAEALGPLFPPALPDRLLSPDGFLSTLRDMGIPEDELRNLSVQKRLINLAVTGRITKQEFERLVERLRGN